MLFREKERGKKERKNEDGRDRRALTCMILACFATWGKR